MARIATGGFIHETNSFMPTLTTLGDFLERSTHGEILRGSAIEPLYDLNTCIAGFTDAARNAGHEVHPTLFAEAEPGGLVEEAAFEAIVQELADACAAAAPDAVYLELHGAMIATHDNDGDALILERVRAAVGPLVPIVATLDLHANVSERMLSAAQTMVAYRTYPHVDMRDTGQRVARALQYLLEGGCSAFARKELDFMMPVNRQNTSAPPMRDLYRALERIEAAEAKNGLVSMSLATGFQPSDIEAPVPTVFAYAKNRAAADRAVGLLHQFVAAAERYFTFDYFSPAEAARFAFDHKGPGSLILADAQDNPGGGGSSDTMFVPRALLETGVRKAAVANVFDPSAAAAAHRAGIGGSIALDLGGRSVSGDSPLREEFEIVALASGPARMTGPMVGGSCIDLGRCALLRARGLDFLVISKRIQCLDQGFFHHLGIDPAGYPVLVLKSAVHFRCHFDSIAAQVLDVLAPGFEAMDFSRLPYSKLRPGIRFHGHGPAAGAARNSAQGMS